MDKGTLTAENIKIGTYRSIKIGTTEHIVEIFRVYPALGLAAVRMKSGQITTCRIKQLY